MLLVEKLLGSSSAVAANYIEDVFSTYLYTGNGGTQTITNGIDLSTKGGLVWVKSRGSAVDNVVYDTARGVGTSATGGANQLVTNTANGTSNGSSGVGARDYLSAFNSDGFTVVYGSGSATGQVMNDGTINFTSWTFRKQAKFFDVVTWTGDGTTPRVISHNLGSVPGCIIAKRTDLAGDWYVYHRRLNGGTNPEQYWTLLNTTGATQGPGSIWGTTAPTSTGFNVGSALNTLPGSGITPTYVAYVFAHDAGGFGATGTDNVISCGSFTTNGSGNATVNLGYEPQFVLMKTTSGTGNWFLFDSMRGMTTSSSPYLFADTSNAEATNSLFTVQPTATGFDVKFGSLSGTLIYIAIRRGPMKTPTTGTSVFSPIASSAATGTTLTTGFPVDAQIFSLRTGTTNKNNTYDRLRGVSSTTTESGVRLITSSTAAETAAGNETRLWDNTSFQMPSTFGGASTVFWNFRRAPGFFDVVCYTGNGVSNRIVPHNLGVAFELAFIKKRSATENWAAWCTDYSMFGLNSSNAASSGYPLNSKETGIDVTNIVGPLSSPNGCNTSSATYVAYLFATVAGVSKVFSYTGNGSNQTINCGFTGGARFVLIKRTDSTGNWTVFDSARGIVAGNDPYLLLNSTAAEVTTLDVVDTDSSGFIVNQEVNTNLNVNNATYIGLAIA
jgi:hypothetical protein